LFQEVRLIFPVTFACFACSIPTPELRTHIPDRFELENHSNTRHALDMAGARSGEHTARSMMHCCGLETAASHWICRPIDSLLPTAAYVCNHRCHFNTPSHCGCARAAARRGTAQGHTRRLSTHRCCKLCGATELSIARRHDKAQTRNQRMGPQSGKPSNCPGPCRILQGPARHFVVRIWCDVTTHRNRTFPFRFLSVVSLFTLIDGRSHIQCFETGVQDLKLTFCVFSSQGIITPLRTRAGRSPRKFSLHRDVWSTRRQQMRLHDGSIER
jgi:hypothetical protein